MYSVVSYYIYKNNKLWKCWVKFFIQFNKMYPKCIHDFIYIYLCTHFIHFYTFCIQMVEKNAWIVKKADISTIYVGYFGKKAFIINWRIVKWIFITTKKENIFATKPKKPHILGHVMIVYDTCVKIWSTNCFLIKHFFIIYLFWKKDFESLSVKR